jgi:hypothetical protein
MSIMSDLREQWRASIVVLADQINYLEADGGRLMYPANGDAKEFTRLWVAKLRAFKLEYEGLLEKTEGMH